MLYVYYILAMHACFNKKQTDRNVFLGRNKSILLKNPYIIDYDKQINVDRSKNLRKLTLYN